MNVTEKEVTTTQKIYELTEQELKELKDEYFNKGIESVKDYLCYCVINSPWKPNIGCVIEFFKDCAAFCRNEADFMPNKKHINFQDFVYGKR